MDNSDDDDIHIFKPRGRTKVDEAWNPKARVGPLLPKMNRPAREGTKKQAVEKVLEAAAARSRSVVGPNKVNIFLSIMTIFLCKLKTISYTNDLLYFIYWFLLF